MQPIVRVRDAVEADEALARDRANVAERAALRKTRAKSLANALADIWRVETHRKRNHNGRPLRRVDAGAARGFDCGCDLPGAQRNCNFALPGTRDRQHQRGRVAKAAEKLDRPRALWQVGDAPELQVHLVEDGLGVVDLVVDLDVDDRQSVERQGFDRVFLRRRRANFRDLGQLLFNFSGDQLLDAVGTDPRPRADDLRLFHRDVGILALGHFLVAINAPREHQQQHYPCNLAVLREEARSVMSRRDYFCVGSMRHESRLRNYVDAGAVVDNIRAPDYHLRARVQPR